MSDKIINVQEATEPAEPVSEWISTNDYLVLTDMQKNADIIIKRMRQEGWTDNAIAALLGNMTSESTINPGLWEGRIEGRLNMGFGLVQWTPATKLRDWIYATYGNEDYGNGDYQLDRIIWELNNGVQFYPRPKYPLTFREWTQSTEPPGYLGAAFMMCYERPLNQSPANQRARGNNAEYWWTYMTGEKPEPSRYPFGLVHRRRKMRRRSIPRR